ncbi:MAG: 2-amino-4-hydroxy-6-hydroxymethyldihydropteridine diphosphokinase [Deltaproteobacteria bacterium]|nr:2-amino-4-hydroxy-6-hydroxymethyldihydropteridine diphosphokinase [Deltaproteobacteria bacterium]
MTTFKVPEHHPPSHHLSRQPSAFDEPVYIGLGTNMGERQANLEAAVAFLNDCDRIRVDAISTFRNSAPWGMTDQPAFLNGAVKISTVLSPDALLAFLKDGERHLGRTPGERWGPRIIDMDILLFGRRMLSSAHLVIPHMQLFHRAFVLEPLLELDPTLCHPQTDIPLQSYLIELTRTHPT